MRPPTGFKFKPGELWKILKPAYGLVESGRHWQATIEPWMTDTNYLDIVAGLSQLFVYRGEQGPARLLIAKVVDDYLLAGSPTEISNFWNAISDRFEVGRFSQDISLVFNHLHKKAACQWRHKRSMEEYMDTISPLTLSRERKMQHESHATQDELTEFLGFIGKLNFLGHGCIPMAVVAASHLQQSTGNLRIADHSAFNEIRQVVPKLLYRSPASISSATYLVFSDAAQDKLPYGQTGLYLRVIS